MTNSAKKLWRWIAAALVLGLFLVPKGARAQTSGAGVLTGTVADASDKKPVADVVVTATSPALQGEEVVVTDSSGFYRIPSLPPGGYTLRFEKESFKPFSRGGVDLRADATLRINVQLLPETVKAEEVTVIARPPVVDVGSSSTGTTITRDFTSRVPVAAPGGKGSANRSFEAVAEVTPGARTDSFGTSIAGTTSLENSYLIDGLSVNNPGYGLIGTPLSTEFIKETNVISGGYMPEYGRATGGTLSAVTKSGSNEFHGGVFSYFSPGGLEGKRALVQPPVGTVLGESELSYIGDVGADIGGPIMRDKLWFYAGIDVSRQVYNIRRKFYRTLTNGTTEIIPGTEQSWKADAQALQAIAKLTYAIDPNNKLTLSLLAAPGSSGGDGKFGIDPKTGYPETYPRASIGSAWPNGTYESTAHKLTSAAYDATLKWTTEFNNKRFLVDTLVGWHHQEEDSLPSDGSLPGSGQGLAAIPHTIWNRNEAGGGFHPITDFETFPNSGLCTPAPGQPTLCPVPNYTTGGPGFINQQTFDRYTAGSVVTYLFQGAGHHIVKAGANVEVTTFKHVKAHSGGVTYNELADAPLIDDTEQYGVLTGPDSPFYEEPLRVKTRSLNAGGFVQDSWSVLDKFTLNVGVRYDTQQLYAADGHVGLSLPNQWSPRAGVIWDPTQEGRAKVFANYARYYENVPLAVNDLTLSGEPSILSQHRYASPPGPDSCDPARSPYCQSQASRVKGVAYGGVSAASQYWNTFGAGSTPIDPNIKASSSDEFVAGAEYEILKDGRLGASYTHRWMNEWIEDMSRDNLQTFILGNPGYGIATDFPKAERTYDAVTLYFMKTFTDDWLMSASYTISYLRGNLSGLYNTANNELNPNHNADYDTKAFTVNRNGPLPGDRNHSIKVFGAKDWVIDPANRVMTGMALRGTSGEPINYWGNHVYYGEKMNMLLPRGSGGRLPWEFSVDLNVGYKFNIDKDKSLGLTVDIFNLFNFQEKTAVDDNYTHANAAGVQNGTLRDVKLTDSGAPLTQADVNPNFKSPTAYQPPRVFRFGIRGTF